MATSERIRKSLLKSWQINQEEVKSNFIVDVKCASALGKSGSKVIIMCIVPVSIKYKNNDKQITTYAMLDNCSHGSFVHEAVL